MVFQRRLLVGSLLIVVACPIFAQQQLPATGESIDVSLVNVDVFVTDRRGQRVTGLTTADFEIRENGRVQPITNFAEYRPEHADQRTGNTRIADAHTAAPHSKRTILFFVERFSVPSFHTQPMFAQLRKTMHEVVRPGDSAAVVFWDQYSAFTLQTFTDDTSLLEGALREVETQSTGVSPADDLMRRQAFARAYFDSLPPDKIARYVSLLVSLLPRVVEDLTTFYSIAYRTPDTGLNKARDISVRTKNRNYVVRSRRQYVEKTDTTRMSDRVIASLYRPDGNGSIKLHAEIGKIDKTSRTRWAAPVRVTIPIDALSTVSDEPGSFSVFVATGGVLGIMSDVQQQTHSYSAADFAPGQEHFTYEFTLAFNGATTALAIGVMDDRSKEFGLETIDVPPYRPKDLVGSD